MRFRDLVQRGKRPWPPSPKGADGVTIDSQSHRGDDGSISGMHMANTSGASQDLSEAGLPIRLSDTRSPRIPESMEEVGHPSRCGSLWTEAYSTIKGDPEYSPLLEAFETYLREAESDVSKESMAKVSTVVEDKNGPDKIQNLARMKLEKLAEARIAFSLHGRRIVVREVIQKAIRTVTAFKPIIGGAVSAEPHAALAWAGILTILPMLENLFQQDEDAANGLNNILFILVRYQELQDTVLSNEFEGSSQTETTRQLLSNIRTKLVSVYAQIYVYQIRFVLQYGRSKWLRHLRNTVSADSWKQMWKDIESTSQLVDQGIQDRVGTRTLETWKAVNDIKASTEEIKNLQISTLETELLLSLPFAGNATFDSAEVLDAESPCLEGTQHRILSDIRDWAEDPAGEAIFWLHGMAGTGKTSVALTVADALNQRKPFTKGIQAPTTAFLGASFFFKQGDATRNSTKAFFPTLARCLAEVFLDFKSLIASEVNKNLAIGTKAPPQQLECLIVRPLASLDDQTFLPIRLVIVVDALDECVKQTEAEELLSMLATLEDLHQVQLRLLITSRTDKHILGSFEKLPKVLHRSMLLDKITPHAEGDGTKDDITFYLSHTLAKIAKKHGVAQDCIDQANINKLSKKSDGLFIYAATACRFLDAEDFDDEEARQERLDQIFHDHSDIDGSETDDWETGAPQYKVDEIYLKVLSFPDREKLSPKTRKRTFDGMRMTLGFLAVLFEPVATSSLENLLPPLPVSLAQLLKKLHAIVGVPRDEKSPLDLVHLSFRDFILSGKRSKQLKFRVNETEMHKKVFCRCLDIMSSKLRRDICGLVMPGVLAFEVPHSRIEESIPQHLRYACRYWVDHLAKLDNFHRREVGLVDGGKVHVFLKQCFLYWLEATSIIKEIPTSILIINQLQTLVIPSEQPDLSSLVYDAKRFILGNRWIVGQAPLQIYSSALIFSPKGSKIRSLFGTHMPRWVTQQPLVEQDWTPQLSTHYIREGTWQAYHFAFSPTDSLVVFISFVGRANLWDYTTGTERFRFDERVWYCSTAFSPDGKSVALGSADGPISVKEFGKGNSIELKGHDSKVSHVAFSPKNGSVLASTSTDGTLRIWNVDEKQTTHICKFSSPSRGEPVVEFTPDGERLIVGARDSMTMWNVDTGECVKAFDEVDLNYFDAVAISADGEKVVCIQARQIVSLYTLSTGKQQFETCYETFVGSISLLPPDDNSVLIGLKGGRIEIRDMENWSVVRQFHTSRTASCFAVSRDGELLALGGSDNTLRLWDMRPGVIGNEVSEKSHDPIEYAYFSPDDSLVVSGKFEDTKAHVWDVADCRTKSLPIDTVPDLPFSPSGKVPALEVVSRFWKLWKTSMTTKALDLTDSHNITFSPDSRCMARLGFRRAEIVDSTTFQEIMTWKKRSMYEIRFSPNGQIVALTLQDLHTTFELWSLQSGQRLWQTILDYDYPGRHSTDLEFSPHFEFSPNGQVIAFLWLCEGREAGYNRYWSWKMVHVGTKKEEWIRLPGGHHGQHLVFHPENHLFAIETLVSSDVSANFYITTYETASMEPRHKFKLHEAVEEGRTPFGMAISATGKLVAASRQFNQTVQVWDTETGIEIGRYSIEGRIDDLSFLDDRYLLCKQGRLPVPSSLPDQEEKDSKENGEDAKDCLFVGSQWVYQGLEKILWLPPAYRSDASALRGETLALAHETGSIRIIKFNLAEAPVSTV